MDLQTILAAAAGLLALAYLGRVLWKTVAGSGCGGGCGCGPKGPAGEKLIRAEDLMLRVRQGDGGGTREMREDDGRGK